MGGGGEGTEAARLEEADVWAIVCRALKALQNHDDMERLGVTLIRRDPLQSFSLEHDNVRVLCQRAPSPRAMEDPYSTVTS